MEGDKNDISLLKSVDSKLKDVIGKTLKSSETGYLLRKIFYLDTDVFLETQKYCHLMKKDLILILQLLILSLMT